MNFADLRLRIRHFFKKYKKIIIIIACIWLVIFIVDKLLSNQKPSTEPTTTYEPHTSVMDNNKKTPVSKQKEIESIIEEYVAACNDGNYQKAYDLLSDDCKKYEYNDSVQRFMEHVLDVMPLPRKYAIQDYSNMSLSDGTNIYIYEVKYFDDFLATGLTDSVYSFSSEKMTFYDNDNNELVMNVGNYIYHGDPDAISENNYLKIDVTDRKVDYDKETYQVLLTNRSNYKIVLYNEQEANEICLKLPNETRMLKETDEIVLEPNESRTVTMTFDKFVDDGDSSQSILFNNVRVMEKYSGVGEDVPEEVQKSELDNAITKIGMSVTIDG